MCNPSLHPRDIEIGDTSSYCSEFSSSQPLTKSTTSASTSVSLFSSSPSKSRYGGNGPSSASKQRTQDQSKADAGLGSAMLDSLPPSQQMVLLSFFMFLFFGMHNILQEAIVNLLNQSEGLAGIRSNSTLMLGYAEVVGVLVFSYLERTKCTNEGGWTREAPLRAYPLLTACLFASSSLSNLSLSYINFPTKVVFRSCKLVPTMIIATIVNQRVFKSYEYLCALSVCAGLVLFAMADYTLDPLQFEPTGLFLVSASVVADAILPNAQEHLFREGSSRLEVTVYSNLFSFLAMTVVTLGNSSLIPFVRGVVADSTLAMYFSVYTVLSYVSISCYMTLVKRFGGVSAVVLTTARKAMTLVLSFLLFPKGFSWLYVYGSLLVLGAVMVASICKKLGSKKGSVEERKPSPPSVISGSPKETKLARAKSHVGADELSSSSYSTFAMSESDDAMSERTPEAILASISKRAYV